ncbi:18 kDa heat shock protein [Scheffersomyces coipomensis]|uniref:18 kDa heat shock protein n=1 Tax=Scheffersomyces coipomensis TaxID=1788519 RepID=UPI00315D9338
MSFYNNFFDSDFEDFFNRGFFNRPRRYESSIPNGYFTPRRLIGNTYPPARSLIPYGYPGEVFPTAFDDDFFKHFNDGKMFVGFDNNVDLKEEQDKYVVTCKFDDLTNKDFKVDFLKKENELKISVAQKISKTDEQTGAKSESSSNYSSSLKFDKPVNPTAITAETKDGNVLITVPKVESDAENVVTIQFNNNGDNVKHVIDEKPAIANQVENESK